MDRADVYHVHVTTGGSVLARLPLLLALRALRRPIVLTMHSGDLRADLAASGPSKRRLTRIAFRLANHVIVTGEETRATVAEIAGCKRVSDVPLYLGDGTCDEDAVPPETREFVARHHPVVIVAGGWRPLYDFETAVDALGMVAQNPGDWPALGAVFLTSFSRNDSPAYRQRILERVQERGLDDRVLLLAPGTTPHAGVLALLRSAQALVRSSRSDATGLVIHEAISQGCSAVASDIGSRPEGCRLYPVGDARALAAVLADTLRAPANHTAPPPAGDDNLFRILALYRKAARARSVPKTTARPR